MPKTTNLSNATIKEMVADPPKIGAPLNRVLHDLDNVEKFAIENFTQAHELCKQQMGTIHQKAAEWRAQYEGGKDAPRGVYYSGTADTYPNITFKHCDTAIAKAMTMMFPSIDFFELDPADRDSRASATVVRQTMQHFIRRGETIPKMEPGIENLCVEGTIILQNMWTYKLSKKRVRTNKPAEEKSRMKLTALSDEQKEEKVELQVTDDYPDIEVIDLQNFFVPDVTVECIEDLDFCGKRFWTTLRSLKRDKLRRNETKDGEVIISGLYDNIDLIPQTEPPVSSSSNTNDEQVDNNSGAPAGLINMSQRVEVLEYYFSSVEDFFERFGDSTYGANSGGDDAWKSYLVNRWGFTDIELEGGLIVTVANSMVPIRFSPMIDLNGDLGKIFILGSWINKKGCLFGIGIPEMIREYQLEACAHDNQALDNLSYQLNKNFFYDDSIGLDPADFAVLRPGMGTPVTNVVPGGSVSNLIYENTPAPLPNDFWSWRASLRREVEEIDGITDIMMGGQSSSEATATEVSARTTASEVRFLRRIKFIERTVIAKLLRNFWDMIDDLVDETLAISIMSKNGDKILTEVKRSQLTGAFIFQPVGAREMQDRFLKSQQMLTILNNPEILRYHDVPAVLHSWYENLGFHNPGAFIKDPMRRRAMLDIETQWKSFMLGQPVEVTGDETLEEHDEAIRAHGETFLKDMLPAMVDNGLVDPQEADFIKDLVMQNVELHNRWIEQKQAERAEQERMMAMEQMFKAGGNQMAAAPFNEAQVRAGSGQFPSPLPASVGA